MVDFRDTMLDDEKIQNGVNIEDAKDEIMSHISNRMVIGHKLADFFISFDVRIPREAYIDLAHYARLQYLIIIITTVQNAGTY